MQNKFETNSWQQTVVKWRSTEYNMRAESKSKDRTVLDGIKWGNGVCFSVRSETASKLGSWIGSVCIFTLDSKCLHLDVITIPLPVNIILKVPKSFGRETSSALTDKQISLLTLVRFSQRLSQDLTPQPLLELRWPISSGVCNKKLPWLSICVGFKSITKSYKWKGKACGTAYSNVLRVQAVLAPCWCYAAVEVRSRASHVQLVLVGLGGNVISHVSASKRELMEEQKTGQIFQVALLSVTSILNSGAVKL